MAEEFKGKCVIFSAPSGAGKTTIVHHLLKQELGLAFSVSACSRDPRGNEVDGKDYYFLGIDGFREKIKQDAFVEWEEVYTNNFYGTLKSEMQRIWSQGKTVIFDVDVIGGLNLKEQFGEDAYAVFVQPPSYEELEKRLRGRSTESEDKINQRMNKARTELSFAPKFDFILVNDDLSEACKKAENLIEEFFRRKMKVGLYFGTFNPIHVGHLIIANYMADYTGLDQVWLVVSPQNPLKDKKSLLADYHRLALVRLAIEDNMKLRASDIEFKLSKPSYTATTLAYLKEKYPGYEFSLIMGEDNLRTFHKWMNYEEILNNHKLYVYPRAITMQEEEELRSMGKLDSSTIVHDHVVKCDDVPVMKVSSSFIRKAIKDGHDVRYLLTEDVREYIEEMSFYK